ncbi:MAG TPA: hypothetical protein VFW66_04465 [Gemmatimonadales bacterium]|nr:hypothetical protein [Gemmatimonadales bacterium]
MNRWKHGLGMAGVTVAVLAVITEQPLAVWIAIALLAASLALRLIERTRRRRLARARDSVSDGRDE